MSNSAFKVGDGKGVLNILFSVEDAKDFIANIEFAIRPKESGGLGRTGEIFISVVGSSVSLDSP